jgi:hypothetical protein
MTHMLRGDFERAWRLSDAERCRRAERQHGQRDLPRHLRSIWDGSSLAGRPVLVRCWHGLGDTLQFIRYVAPLRAQVTSVTVEAPPELIPLLAGMKEIDCLIPLHDDDAVCDAATLQIEVGELPYAFRTTLATVPACER